MNSDETSAAKGNLPTFRSYIWAAIFTWTPFGLATAAVKDAPLWMGLVGAACFVGVAAFIWVVSFLCRRYGGQLGEKLTRPLG